MITCGSGSKGGKNNIWCQKLGLWFPGEERASTRSLPGEGLLCTAGVPLPVWEHTTAAVRALWGTHTNGMCCILATCAHR